VNVAPRVAVVVVSYEGREALLASLESLRLHAAIPIETVVVDNASADGSADAVRAAHPEVRVLANATNVGFATACNQGWRASTAPFVLFLNPDAEVMPAAVETLVALLEERTDAAAVGPRTRSSDGTIQVSTGAISTSSRSGASAGSSAGWPAATPGRSPKRSAGTAGSTSPTGCRGPAWPSVAPRWRASPASTRLLPLRGGCGPVPASPRGRLAHPVHPRGRGSSSPRPQHAQGRPARPPRVPPQPPAVLPQAQRPCRPAILRTLLAARGVVQWLRGRARGETEMAEDAAALLRLVFGP